MLRTHTCLLLSTLLLCIALQKPIPCGNAAEPCKEWVAKVVSVQGSVQAKRAATIEWLPVKVHDTFCLGDVLRAQDRSQAAIMLPNETMFRLDEKTVITINGLEKKSPSLFDLITGAAH